MYATNVGLIFTDLPSEEAVYEKRGGIYDTAEAAWQYLLGTATSHWHMANVSIDNIEIRITQGTPDELRREKCRLTRRFRRLAAWIKFSKPRCQPAQRE